MIDRLKERLGEQLTSQQYGTILGYISALSCSTVITVAKASRWIKIDSALAEDVLNALTDIGTLQKYHGVFCPRCGVFLEKVKYASDYEDETYCYGCNNDINVTARNIDVCYSLQNRR